MENMNKTCPTCGKQQEHLQPHCQQNGFQGKTGDMPQCSAKNQDETLEGQLVQKLHRTAHTLRHATGGRTGQNRILRILAKEGGMNQRALMELLEIQAGSLSEALSKLEGAGLIMRKPNEADRRSVDIVLTDEGAAAAQLAEKQAAAGAQMLDCLSDEEKQQLNTLLGKLDENWRALYPGRGGHGPHSCKGRRRGEHCGHGDGPHGEHGPHGKHCKRGEHGEHPSHRHGAEMHGQRDTLA